MKSTFLLFLSLFLFTISAKNYTYLTWRTADIHRNVTIQFLSLEKINDGVQVVFDVEEHSHSSNYKYQEWAQVKSISFLDSIYYKKYRNGFLAQKKYHYWYVYSIHLQGLTPNTLYYFSVTDAQFNPLSAKKKFRTPPLEDVRVVVGGDMGYTNLEKLLQNAAKVKPHAALIGGDIAYANGNKKNASRWLLWLDYWQKYMITEEGCTIPLILSIGNHEVKNTLFLYQAPFYFSLFSQDAKSYFTRLLGNQAVLIVLDSGHITSHQKQTGWLENELKKYNHIPFKIALYHVPLYPSHRNFEGSLSAKGRKEWLPLFDKYNLTLGLEHHDHSFKRTKPLRNNKVVKKGTIYLGDGCFGRSPRSVDTKRFYLEKASATKHFWFLEISPEKILAKAIDEEGKIIDQLFIEK